MMMRFYSPPTPSAETKRMASSPSPSRFSLFTHLPPELRLQIWRESMPDMDGIGLHHYKKGCWNARRATKGESFERPADARADMEPPVFEFQHGKLDAVQVDVPLAFVSREARGVALDWARSQGIEMRYCTEKKCHVFVHPFSLAQDALIIGMHQWEDFHIEPYERLVQPPLYGQPVIVNTEITRIALPQPTIWTDCYTVTDLFQWFPRLQVLYIVLDMQIDPTTERLMLQSDRKKTKNYLQQRRWKVGDVQGKALVWNNAERRFDWRDGADIGDDQDRVYRKMWKTAEELNKVFAPRESVCFEMRSVYAVKGW